MQTKLVAYLQI